MISSGAPTQSLAALAKGRRAVVRGIARLEARIALMNMGLVPGDTVELTDVAPGGCPIAIRVRGTKIAMRRAVAEGIEIEPA